MKSKAEQLTSGLVSSSTPPGVVASGIAPAASPFGPMQGAGPHVMGAPVFGFPVTSEPVVVDRASFARTVALAVLGQNEESTAQRARPFDREAVEDARDLLEKAAENVNAYLDTLDAEEDEQADEKSAAKAKKAAKKAKRTG